MSSQIVYTRRAPTPPRSYSQAKKSGGFVFVSGQPPFDPVTGEVVGTTIQEQTAQSLRDVEAILIAAGSSLSKAVSATVIIAEESDFAGMNEEWEKWFPVNPPPRQGAKLPVRPKGIRISVAVVAEA
jgi:2-iminobutanoate/2-iminopropanoate deaminase